MLIDYPRLFKMVYLSPIAIEASAFLAIHQAIESFFASRNQPTSIPTPEGKAKGANVRTGALYSRAPGDPLFNPVGDIAVIPISGPIMRHAPADEMCFSGTLVGDLETAIRQAMADPSIRTILLDINSPGGTVTGIPEAAALIAEAKKSKTVYAFTDSSMCSAAYWLGSQADMIFATPSAMVGSIGVYIAFLDETLALERAGKKLELFKEGEHKGMGLPGNPLSEKDREFLRNQVRELTTWFHSAVKSGRGDVSAETMQGQTFFGDEAISRHLVDVSVQSYQEIIDAIQKGDV